MAQKPITLIRQEFIENLTKQINETPLPAFIVADILDRVTDQVKQIAVAQAQQDAAAYQEQLAKEAEQERLRNQKPEVAHED